MATIVIHDKIVTTNEHISVYREDGTCVNTGYETTQYFNEEVPICDVYDVEVLFDITKSKDDEGLVSGWANVAVNADGSIPLDWQGDVIKPEVLEKAAINFMLDYRGSGVMHEGSEQGAVVESIVFTKEKQAALGIPEGCVPEGWFITVKVKNPDVFKAVKEGKYRMFSIQGTAKRVEL